MFIDVLVVQSIVLFKAPRLQIEKEARHEKNQAIHFIVNSDTHLVSGYLYSNDHRGGKRSATFTGCNRTSSL
jgi:hypothetical protein